MSQILSNHIRAHIYMSF